MNHLFVVRRASFEGGNQSQPALFFDPPSDGRLQSLLRFFDGDFQGNLERNALFSFGDVRSLATAKFLQSRLPGIEYVPSDLLAIDVGCYDSKPSTFSPEDLIEASDTVLNPYHSEIDTLFLVCPPLLAVYYPDHVLDNTYEGKIPTPEPGGSVCVRPGASAYQIIP